MADSLVATTATQESEHSSRAEHDADEVDEADTAESFIAINDALSTLEETEDHIAATAVTLMKPVPATASSPASLTPRTMRSFTSTQSLPPLSYSTSSSIPPSRLLLHTLSCLASLNTQRMTVASHVDEFLSEHDELKSNQEASSIVRELVYSLIRYSSFLQLTLDGFYARYTSSVSRSDRKMYELLTVLVVFKLGEIGGPVAMRKYWIPADGAMSAHKLHTLLTFLTTPSSHEWLNTQWQSIYDPSYVEFLLGRITKEKDEFDVIMTELSKLAHSETMNANDDDSINNGLPRPNKKESTVPAPFKLTAPKVRLLPSPTEVYSTDYKASPLPQPTASLQERQQAESIKRRENEARTREKNEIEQRKRVPKLSTETRGNLMHISEEKKRKEKEEKERKDAKERRDARSSPPTSSSSSQPSNVAPPRSTVTTILREDALYRRKQQEIREELYRFETELRDEEEFFLWQRKMEKMDDAEREKAIAERKEASKQSALLAAKAVARTQKEKRVEVAEIREDLRELNQKKVEHESLVLELKKNLVSDVKETKKLIPLAQESKLKQNVAQAKKVQKETDELVKKAKREREEEVKKKRKMITEIQEMEKAVEERRKSGLGKSKEENAASSLSAPPSFIGLLEDLTLTELSERWSQMKSDEQKYIESKRSAILKEKERKQQVLSHIQKRTEKLRSRTKEEYELDKIQRLEEKQEEQEKVMQKYETDVEKFTTAQAEAQDKKKQEALRLARELRSKKVQNDFYTYHKSVNEVHRADDLRKAEDRRKRNQVEVDEEVTRMKELEQVTQEKNRAEVKQVRQNDIIERRAEADRTLIQRRKEDEKFIEEERTVKEFQHSEIKKERDIQVEKERNKNQYAKMIVQREIKKAKIQQQQQQKSISKKTSASSSTVTLPLLATNSSALELSSTTSQYIASPAHQQQKHDPLEEEKTQQQPGIDSITTSTLPLGETMKRGSLSAKTSARRTTATKANGATGVQLAAH